MGDAARYVAAERGPDGHNLTDFEFMGGHGGDLFLVTLDFLTAHDNPRASPPGDYEDWDVPTKSHRVPVALSLEARRRV